MSEVIYNGAHGALYGLHHSKASQAKVHHWICVIDIVIIVLFLLTGAGYYTLYDEQPESAAGNGVSSREQQRVVADIPNIPDNKPRGSSLLNPYHHEGFYGYNGFKIITEQHPEQIIVNQVPKEKPTVVTQNLLPSPDLFELPSVANTAGDGSGSRGKFGFADGKGIGGFWSDTIHIADEFVQMEFDTVPKLLNRELQWRRPVKPSYPLAPLQAHIECRALVLVYVDENGLFTKLPDSIVGDRSTMEYELNGQKHELEYACRMIYFIKDGNTKKRIDTLTSEQAMKYMADFYREYTGDSYNFYDDGYSIDADFSRELILSLIKRGNIPAVVDGKSVGSLVAVSWNFEILRNQIDWLRAEFQRVQYQTH